MKKLSPLILLCVLVACASPAQMRANRGMASFEKQKYKKSAAQLGKAVERGYDEPGVHYALGQSYLYIGKYDLAATHLEMAAAESAGVWFKLGNSYYNMDQYEKAAGAYRKAIFLKPDYLEAIEALAMLYPDGVTRQEALDLWKKALELETRDEWITRAKHYIEQYEKNE